MAAEALPWTSDDLAVWRGWLDRYEDVIAAQGVSRLPALDEWYQRELPTLINGRQPPYVTRDELARATEWKMARGVWRQRNLLLVRSNDGALVEQTSCDALAAIQDPMAPITLLAKLAGVGPATASAIVAAAAPGHYPFFDELVARQIPSLPEVAFTTSYYRRYAEAIRERATRLGDGWTPASVERALWAASGGKVAPRDPSAR
jgi:hypothetical protein